MTQFAARKIENVQEHKPQPLRNTLMYIIKGVRKAMLRF